MVREFPGLQVIAIPNLYFPAFHPDVIHVPHPQGGTVRSPAGDYNSAIVVWGWKHGLTEEQILARFSRDTLIALGYPWRWNAAVARLRMLFEASDLDFAEFFLPLRRGHAFMLGDNHPRIDALVQIARQVGDAARRVAGARPVPLGRRHTRRAAWPPDRCGRCIPSWPRSSGSEVASCGAWPTAPCSRWIDFVAASLAGYDALDPEEVKVPAFDHPWWDDVLPREPVSCPMTAHHPYRDLPDYQFWPRAVSWAAPGGLDPVVVDEVPGRRRTIVSRRSAVASLSTCRRHLSRSGLTYFVAEQAPDDLSADRGAAPQLRRVLRALRQRLHRGPGRSAVPSRLRRLRPGRASLDARQRVCRSVPSPDRARRFRRHRGAPSRSAASLRRDPCRVRRVRRAGVHARAHRSVAVTGRRRGLSDCSWRGRRKL